jgi:hypothetical protein
MADDREGRGRDRDRDRDKQKDKPGGAASEDDPRRTRFSRLGEQISGLLDPDSALRRGQDLVTGVTQATKEELMRIVSSEVRSFLDKIDAVDMLQQVVAGLVVDVNMQVRFSRAADGMAQARVTKQDTQIRSKEPPPAAAATDRDEDDDDAP